MLRPEDLIAARLLFQRVPERSEALLAALDARRQDPSERSLLASLADDGVLTREQAQYVWHQVEAYKRDRLREVYLHLLAEAGVPQAEVARLAADAGAEGEADGVAAAALARGLLPPEREQQVRFQARLVLDRDLASQVQQFHASQAGADAPPELVRAEVTAELERPVLAPPAEAVGELVRGTLSDADDSLPGPQFRIPGAVDMSDGLTGSLVGPYRILGRIGAGAMGTVYLADARSDPTRPVALKLLPPDAPKEAKGRFKREILANSFFSHPGALDVYDAAETPGGGYYLAMEYFVGNDLERVLTETTKLPPRTAFELARQCFETLGAAHQAGIVHRDVKPGNILVSADYGAARLMDFGIAIINDLEGFQKQVYSSDDGTVTGTPEYMSPEQAANEALTGSSDLYSMGVVLYHLLSGRLPFESESSGGFMTLHILEPPLPLAKADSGLKSSLPKEAFALVEALLAKSPGKRPADAAAVVAAIDALLPRVVEGGGSGIFRLFGWG